MASPNDQQPSKKRNIIFIASSLAAVGVVVLIAVVTLGKIKSNSTGAAATSQEQFETTPELSLNLQKECQDSAVQISTLKNTQALMQEFKSHIDNCREIYFSLENESPFRKEGMYADLSVDLAHFASKENKEKALEILNFAKSLKPWEFYLGPVSCDSHHVLDAYIESLNLPSEKSCITLEQYKEKLIPQLQNKNFSILKTMLSNAEVVWMGQPESDVGCPEKISSVIEVIEKLASGTITISEPTPEEAQQSDLVLSLKSNTQDKLALVFKPENSCLQIRSLLVPNLEVVE